MLMLLIVNINGDFESLISSENMVVSHPGCP